MMPTFSWSRQQPPAEIRALISDKRGQLDRLNAEITDARDNYADARQDMDFAFASYWYGQVQKLQTKAAALEDEIRELAAMLESEGA